jgi:hypothetical protein
MLQTFVEACCPTVAVAVTVPGFVQELATGCPDEVGYVPGTQMCRRILACQMPGYEALADTGRLRRVDSSSDKLSGVAIRILPGSGLGLEVGKPARQTEHQVEVPAVDTDDAVNAVTAANKLVKQNCGVAKAVVDMAEDAHCQLFVAVVGKELRGPQDDCNNLQGPAGAAMCFVGVSLCRVQVVALAGL